MRIAVLLLCGALAACTAGPGGRYALKRTANPSEVVATELAFARAAQDDGQWTAFQEYAAEEGVMFVPEAVNAREWLKKQENPARAVAWQPHQVWSSCDGSLAVTKGAWQRPDGATGYFTTVWERQGNGDYRWLMDQGDALPQPLEAPEFIDATVAECGKPGVAAPLGASESAGGQGFGSLAADGTLAWQVVVRADRSRKVRATFWDGTAWQTAFDLEVRP